MDVQNFDHSHHALKIRGLSSGVDVLSFEGKEQLSAPHSAMTFSLPAAISLLRRSRC